MFSQRWFNPFFFGRRYYGRLTYANSPGRDAPSLRIAVSAWLTRNAVSSSETRSLSSPFQGRLAVSTYVARGASSAGETRSAASAVQVRTVASAYTARFAASEREDRDQESASEGV